MRKIMKFMLCMMMGAAMILAASCKKDETPEPNQPSPSGNNGGTNSGEGIYLGIIGFNDQQTIKNIGILNSSTVYDYTSFIDDLSKGNGTGLYYADYMALKMMRECTPPPKLKNVALVTFTDGLDNISLANDSYNPENYGSQAAYREALHNMIVNEQIHGQNVAAYTIGLKGNDVTDNNLFMETLQKLASNNNNVFQVANMNEAIQRFNEIAANLNSISTSVNLGVDVPGGYDDGQLLRFTFDNASSATNSSRYIEATYRRSDGRTLESITYHGLAQGPSSISSSSSQGAYYHFLFEDLKYTDGSSLSQSDINRIMLWKRTSTGGWDRESEFDPASSSTITEDKNSALIMLVLDCTNSLGSDFVNMQQAGKTFVRTLANAGGSGDNPGGSTAPTGAINGLFSVSSTQQVYFSKGNLAYLSGYTFNSPQWAYFGNNTSSGWRDLFGWGTGNNPTATSGNYSHFYDWGDYSISNGGNSSYLWRTLSVSEWQYLLESRSTSSGIRIAIATVNGVYGMILLPDNWSTSYFSLYSTNNMNAAYSSNTISSSDWTNKLETHGAVFLPVTGYYVNNEYSSGDGYGYYWTSSLTNDGSPYMIGFFGGARDGGYYHPNSGYYFHVAVRLVRNA